MIGYEGRSVRGPAFVQVRLSEQIQQPQQDDGQNDYD
jgi:hypothetical protein